MKNVLSLALLVMITLGGFSSCEKEEEPTINEQVIGSWDAVRFLIGNEDWIADGTYLSIQFEFENDGDFEWTGIGSDGSTDFGSGSWVVDGNYLEIDFNPNALTFCDDSDHRFNIDFDGNDELNLEDQCISGSSIKIELDKN